MNFGNNIKKFAANLNVGLKYFKPTGEYKPNVGIIFDTLKNKDASFVKKQLNSLPLYINQKESFLCAIPKTDLAIKKNIIEPDQSTRVKIEFPLRNTRNKSLELPFHTVKEINEPSTEVVIIKEARHMLVVRRKKMKKHKKKKHLKKFRIQIQTRKLRKELMEENALQKEMEKLIDNSVNFSAENHVNEKLEKFNWVRPVTAVRGRLAPDWVIKKHLKHEEEKKIFRQRVNECVHAKK